MVMLVFKRKKRKASNSNSMLIKSLWMTEKWKLAQKGNVVWIIRTFHVWLWQTKTIRHEKSFHFASTNGSVLFTEHFAQIFIYIYTIPINHISFVPCININSICVFKGGIVSGHKDSHTFVPGCVEARTSNGPWKLDGKQKRNQYKDYWIFLVRQSKWRKALYV